MTLSSLRLLELVLLGLFGLGAVRLIRSWLRLPSPIHAGRLVLAVLVALPVLAYVAVGLVRPQFGNPRNFFYLLPLYLMVAFHGLEWLAAGQLARRVLAGALIVTLGGVGAREGYATWQQRHVDRALLRRAAVLEGDVVLISSAYRSTYPAAYYLRRYGAYGRAVPFEPTEQKFSRWAKWHERRQRERVAAAERLTLVEASSAAEPSTSTERRLFGRTLVRDDGSTEHGFYGPWPLLQRWFDSPVRLEVYRARP